MRRHDDDFNNRCVRHPQRATGCSATFVVFGEPQLDLASSSAYVAATVPNFISPKVIEWVIVVVR